MQVVPKEDFLCKIKVTVARPLSDKKAFCGRHTQAVQGHVGDFDLAETQLA